jgi:O-antigen/teichoic acid export membrane protein
MGLNSFFLGNFLYKKILQFSKRPFIRNVVMVASGTAMAQAISMIFSPLITRLYGPDAYGLQGVFLSIASIMGAIASMTYPVAIVLPKSDIDAVGLVWLSIYIGIAMSLLTLVILFFFGPEILTLLQAEEISAFIYLIPAFMFISVVSTVLGQWLIRKKAFTLTAKVTVWQTLIINMIKASFGLVHPTAAVLIITNTLGGLLSAVMIFFGLRKTRKASQQEAKVSKTRLSTWALAKRHRDFPLLRAPQVLLNSVSHSLPVIMLATYFGPATVGFYSIASAVLAIPAGLIGNSVMQVFYPRINEAIHRGEDAKALIIKATAGLALSGALPFAAVIVAGPTLFSFVFGEKWQVAGVYAQWLALWLFFQYINKPAVSAIPALRLQRGLLIYELFSTGSKVLALYLGYTHFKSDVAAIALFSVFGVVAYSWLILWVIFHSGKLAAQSQLGTNLR